MGCAWVVGLGVGSVVEVLYWKRRGMRADVDMKPFKQPLLFEKAVAGDEMSRCRRESASTGGGLWVARAERAARHAWPICPVTGLNHEMTFAGFVATGSTKDGPLVCLSDLQ